MSTMLWLALSVGAPIEAPADETKAPLTKIQGVWKVTAVESRGTDQPLERLANPERMTLVVVGDVYVFLTHAGTIKLDPEGKSLDLAITDGRYKNRASQGLFELNGDTLKIALSSPGSRTTTRPTDMKTTQTTTHTLYTFTREKATKEQAEAKLKELKEAVAAVQVPNGFPPNGRTTPAAAERATQELLRQVLDKLERIEKRLDEMEKKKEEKK